MQVYNSETREFEVWPEGVRPDRLGIDVEALEARLNSMRRHLDGCDTKAVRARVKANYDEGFRRIRERDEAARKSCSRVCIRSGDGMCHCEMESVSRFLPRKGVFDRLAAWVFG